MGPLRRRLLVAPGASHCFHRVILWIIYVRGHWVRFECAAVEWAGEIGRPICARVKPRRVVRWMHDERHAIVDPCERRACWCRDNREGLFPHVANLASG